MANRFYGKGKQKIGTAQVNLTTARAQEVQAKVDFVIARSSLDRALGRRNAETGN